MMRGAGCTKKVIVGGLGRALLTARASITEGGIMNAHASLVYRAITLRGAALPMTDQEDFLESSKALGCFLDAITQGDGVVSGETVLDIGFSKREPRYPCSWYAPGAFPRRRQLQHGAPYEQARLSSIYSHSFCPSISEVQYQFYNEEIALANAIGVGIQPFDKEVFYQRTSVLGQEYMGEGCDVPFDEEWEVGYGTGPFTIQNRYVTEDVPVGCHVYHELGKKFGVPTPIIDSMIVLGGVMNKTDYFESGLKLEDLGIGHMDKEALLAYLNEGVYTE